MVHFILKLFIIILVYSIPNIAIPIAAIKITIYCFANSFSFKIILLHTKDNIQYDEIIGAAKIAFASIAKMYANCPAVSDKAAVIFDFSFKI